MTAIVGARGIAEQEFRSRGEIALGAMDRRGGGLRRNWTAGDFCVGISYHAVDTQDGLFAQSGGAVSVAYDGSIYCADGRRVGAASDRTRTCRDLIAAYQLRGPDMFGSLEGSFALVLLDETRRRMYLVKDTFGTKPMFYSEQGGALFFSSEIPGLFALSPYDRDPDACALDTYLTLGYVPAPRTMFKGVRQLTPGHYLEIGEDGVVAERCHRWPPSQVFPPAPEQDWVPTLRKVLAESVAKRFETHPGAGILLSGGVDTAAIVGAAAQQALPLRTFTIGFPGCPGLDESQAARWLAQRVGAHHTEIAVDENCLLHLDNVITHVGAPVANPAALIAISLFAQVGNHVDAALCGDGGNEIFGGTYKYHQLMHYVVENGRTTGRSLVRSVGQRVWRQVEDTPLDGLFQRLARRYFENVGQQSAASVESMDPVQFDKAARYYAALNSIWTSRTKDGLYSAELRAELTGADSAGPLVSLFSHERDTSLLQQVAYVRATSFIPYEVMPYCEFSAVANRVVPLFPLLDEQLTGLMFRMPYHLVFGRGFRHFMATALSGNVVPAAVFRRGHKGFKPPLDTWFRTPLWRGRVEELLSAESVRDRGLFSPPFVRDIIRRYYTGEQYLVVEDNGRVLPLADLLWSLVALEAWLRQCRRHVCFPPDAAGPRARPR